MQMDQVERVIVWDGTNKDRVGTLVQPSKALHAEETHGRIVTLPTDTRMFGASALGGFFLRQWGAGVRFEDLRPRRGCPMVLHVVQDLSYVHWAIRIERANKEAGMRGTLAIVGTNEPVIPMCGVLSAVNRPIDLAQIGEPDERGGWTLKGRLLLRTMQDGLCPLAVQAVTDNLVIRWTAITQSRSDE
jgi:hypothetical protein